MKENIWIVIYLSIFGLHCIFFFRFRFVYFNLILFDVACRIYLIFIVENRISDTWIHHSSNFYHRLAIAFLSYMISEWNEKMSIVYWKSIVVLATLDIVRSDFIHLLNYICFPKNVKRFFVFSNIFMANCIYRDLYGNEWTEESRNRKFQLKGNKNAIQC